MFHKADFLDSLAEETSILKNLGGVLTAADLDYRPASGMRSTRELLGYLTHCAMSPTHALVHDDWEGIAPYREAAADTDLENFPARLDAQLAGVEKLLAPFSDEAMRERQMTMPWGRTGTMARMLVEMTLKFMTAYRMQLFVYAKAAGHSELETRHCWMA